MSTPTSSPTSPADAPRVEVHHDRDALATSIAGELLIRLADAQVDGGTPHVGLTGGTIAGAVQILKDAGAKDVIIAATHAVFSDPAAQRLGECGAREVVVTNTLPIPEEKRFETLTVLSIAPLIARAIREVFEDGSVTSLFDGVA